MEITLTLFFYLYLVIVGGFLIFAFFELYHLFKFGFLTFGAIILAIIFVAVTGLILFFSWQTIQTVDWSEQFNFFEINNNF